jgi:DNA invertase Pin-like site-specific DNA recombinase
VTDGRAQGVVLAAYDRLLRPDRWDDLFVLQVLADARAQIYVPSGPIDLRTEPGFIQAAFGNIMAAIEKGRIKERTMRAKEQKRREGKLASGRPPFGLRFDKATSRWSYEESEVKVVRELFALFLSGRERSYKRLGARFGFHDTHVRALLQHPAYSGWLVWDREDERGTLRVALPLPPIISDEDFSEVQKIIETRSSRLSLAREGSKGRFLYRGMLFCTCGAPLYPAVKRPRGKRWDMYACRTTKEGEHCGASYMSAHLLEPGLDRIIERRLTKPSFLRAAVLEFNRAAEAAWRAEMPTPDTGRSRGQELEAKRARVMDAFVDGAIDKPERDRRLATIDAQIEGLRTFDFPASRPARVELQAVQELLHVFREWSLLEWGQRRKVLEALTPAFEVRSYEVRGVWVPGLCPEQGDSRTAAGWAKHRSGLWLALGVGAA